ncbi:beta-hexosaminidase subunit beta-like [Echinops telfairi]|uniref:Beta-hexosaminidase subunit beta-like n=1 Tax=Echinops telfairi TaxID=9371 RepID=A0AC55CQZ4_ECHTE|nr:beta-hexosaminidase subunit beta-like [Echinops telfairi]
MWLWPSSPRRRCAPVLFALLALPAAQLVAQASRAPALWPLPLSVKMTPRQLLVSPESFYFAHGPNSTAGPSCAILQEAFRRYYEYSFGFYNRYHGPNKFRAGAELQKLLVTIALDSECDTFPSISSDESYSLLVQEPVAVLKANRVWGALRGTCFVLLSLLFSQRFLESAVVKRCSRGLCRQRRICPAVTILILPCCYS